MADGSINIDLLLNDKSDPTWTEFNAKAEKQGKSGYEKFKDAFKGDPLVAKLEAQADKAGINDFRELLNKLPKEKQTELLAKAQKGEAIDFQKFIKDIPDAKKIMLEAQAKRAGIDNFEELLKKLPKKTLTDLQTRAEKGEVINFEKELKKLPSKVVSTVELNDNASTGLRSLKKQASEVGDRFHRLKDIMIGTFAANALMGGIHAITSGIKDMTKAGMEYNKEQDTMKTVWTALTTEAPEDGKKLLDYINTLSQHSIYAADDINKMAQSFYHVHSNVDETKKWTDAFVALGSTLHMTGPQISESGEMFAKIVAGGKASAEDMSVMINRFPMFGEALQKATGKSMKELYAMSAAGKLSATQFTEALDYLGEKYKGGTAEAMTSMQGMSMYLKSRLSVLSGEVMKSSFNMSKSATEALQKITSDDSMKKFAAGISSGMSVALGGISKVITYISNHSKDIIGIIGSIKDIAGALIGGVWDVAKGTLGGIAGAFGLIGGNSKKAHDPLKTLSSVLGEVAKHKDLIRALGAALLAAFAVKKLADFVSGMTAVIKTLKLVTATTKIAAAAQKIFNLVLKANPIGIIITVLTAVGVAFYELYKHNKKFREFIDGLVKGAADFFKGIDKWFGEAGKAIGKFFGGLGKWASNGTKSLGKFFSGLGKWFGGIGKSIGSGANVFGKWFSGLVKGFVKGWNAFINTAVKMAKMFVKVLFVALMFPAGIAFIITKPLIAPLKKIFNTLINWIKKAWNSTTKFLSKVFEPVKKAWSAALKFISNLWEREWNGITKLFKMIWNALTKFFKKELDFWEDVISDTLKFISKIWNKVWDSVSDFFEKTWKGMKKFFKPIIDWLGDVISDTLNWIKKIWRKAWDTVTDVFSDAWSNIKKAGSKGINALKNTLDNVLDKIGKSFSNTWKGVKNGFGDMWDGMKSLAGKGINAVIKIPNAGIDGINGLIHDFGGPKHALGKIPKVAFATGTGAFGNVRRAITNPTMAVLNDGFDSPATGNKEALIHPNGAMEVVQGRNTERLLMPGTEVLNASELAMIMGQQHFANGTGFLGSIWDGAKGVAGTVGHVAGNAWDGIKSGVGKFTKMLGFITNAVAHPIKTMEKTFNPVASGMGAMFNGLGKGAFGKVKDQAKDWWGSLWSMAKDSSDSGASAGNGGNDYPWKSVGKDSGADPWGYFYRECVSFVASRLKNMGVSPSLFSHLGNGSDWVNAKVAHSSNPKPGDVAVYGPGSEFGNHVAMVNGVQGNKISGEEYNWNGDGKYHTYQGRNKSGATTFLNFGNSSSGQKKEVSATGPMQKLIKGQVGGMFNWINKFISPLNNSSSGTDNDVHSWSGDVKKALGKLGLSTSGSMVSKVLKQIQTESGGNAKALGGNDGLSDGNATGLMQVKPGTFKAFAAKGHNNIMNGYDNILAGLAYAKSRYGSDLSFLGQGHGYENGGWAHKPSIFGEIPGQPEIAINPARATADEHINEAIVARAKKAPNSLSAKMAGIVQGAKSGMQSMMAPQPVFAGTAGRFGNGGIDLSGDVHMTIKMDSGEVARATYPKIKVLRDQEFQLKGQTTGNTYDY
ncbi:CHAP domain-containing protein [Leuconostoc carnosum]|uniref:tape measure protein n=1 Tax=Leuconostoc carnosum TaxID=1252 RepID=UPI00123B7CF4|nr:tape measure protein [Leuconostoc carnosum]KAA8371890.1 CHAP domain-containing protein [Leuconostoc carnosum]KAA8377116.1 CHAP domain-containing protein [Leuconostoc carnosum]